MDADRDLLFLAAVERPLSVVFRATEDTWEGHDYRVEVVAERRGLDAYDVVVDFRDLETHLDALLGPLQGKLLSGPELDGPAKLATWLLAALAPSVPPPARLAEVRLTDGLGRSVVVRS